MRVPGKYLTHLLQLAALAGISPGLAICSGISSEATRALVLNHAAIIETTAGSIQADMALVIGGDKIDTIVPASQYQPQPDAEIIDLGGQFVVPGFIEMHAHI